jgi:hypothetical protein
MSGLKHLFLSAEGAAEDSRVQSGARRNPRDIPKKRFRPARAEENLVMPNGGSSKPIPGPALLSRLILRPVGRVVGGA